MRCPCRSSDDECTENSPVSDGVVAGVAPIVLCTVVVIVFCEESVWLGGMKLGRFDCGVTVLAEDV